jgi:hypothetical protein
VKNASLSKTVYINTKESGMRKKYRALNDKISSSQKPPCEWLQSQ